MEKIREKGKKNKDMLQVLLPIVGVLAAVKGALYELVMGSGLSVLQALLEQEREHLCGTRYRHDARRSASRAGYAPGELVLGGRRVQVKRPRVRSQDGRELALPSWERFASEDPLGQRAVEQMVLGVATRKYERSLEPAPPEVRARGTSKSAVSRRFVEATGKALKDWLARSLTDLSLAAIMIDGLVCGENTVLLALGIDEKGMKHVLGVWEGATENSVSCKALLSNLVDRGLDTTRTMLFVIDGSKALAKAVRDTFGKRALIQRCQVHKRRNVLDHLPEHRRSAVGATITTAYRSPDPKRAQALLEKLARQLEYKHPSAASSLREGLEETLTVAKLGLPEALDRSLMTTNPIENINSVLRRVLRNVKRWRGGAMALRWVGVGLHEATKGFRRIRGHQGLAQLVAALRAHDKALTKELAPAVKAA